MKQHTIIWILSIGLLLTMIIALGVGAFSIPVQDVLILLIQKFGLMHDVQVDETYNDVLYIVRFPRVLLGVLVGAALGMSGAAIQGIFRNPLAEPGLIGISAGASLFAVLIIAFETVLFVGLSQLLGYYLLAFAAFVGAGLTSFLVYQLSKKQGIPRVTTMLLAGIAINAFAGALTGLITYIADEQQLRTITFWMLGSLGGATWDNVIAIFPFILIPLFILPFFSKPLNAFALGETQADLLGMRTDLVKRWVVVLSTMAVGASVAVSGIIGFVGLLVPHTVRLLGGVEHRYVLIASAVFGSLILTLADIISRVLVAPIELPIGVVTALLGTPVFLYILMTEE
ncbi:iron ABC transporter permease [Sphingobacterium olei]|uniref:Iron ABC transporter permease n=1 Tax=Sphingobacterium olei TaxID=2571155 RepID=A0A4V5MNY6_9SPHI|nr:iron ABC transporter permease [Sphingobacterium olei]TJZ63208.1 iron ABC transporter permease [Sphingobacterium olei]